MNDTTRDVTVDEANRIANEPLRQTGGFIHLRDAARYQDVVRNLAAQVERLTAERIANIHADLEAIEQLEMVIAQRDALTAERGALRDACIDLLHDLASPDRIDGDMCCMLCYASAFKGDTVEHIDGFACAKLASMVEASPTSPLPHQDHSPEEPN